MQEFILKNLITIIFVLLIVYGFIKGFSLGFLKTLLSFGSILITIVVTKTLTPIASNMVKDMTNIESSLTSIIYDAFSNTNIYDSINIPWFKAQIDTGNLESTIRDGICTSIANHIINLCCGIAIFILVMIIIRLLLKVLDVVDYIPLVSQFNRILGGCLGAVQMLLVVLIILTVLRAFSAAPQIRTITDNIQSSYIVGYLYENNVVYNFFSNIFTSFT